MGSCGRFRQMHEEVLAVPHRGDHRHQRPDPLVRIRRVHREAVGAGHEPEVAGEAEARSRLDPGDACRFA